MNVKVKNLQSVKKKKNKLKIDSTLTYVPVILSHVNKNLAPGRRKGRRNNEKLFTLEGNRNHRMQSQLVSVTEQDFAFLKHSRVNLSSLV